MPTHPASIFTNLPPRKRLSRPKLELKKKEEEDSGDEKGADGLRRGWDPYVHPENWMKSGGERRNYGGKCLKNLRVLF